MSELDLRNVEEVEVQQQIPMPPVEEIVRQAMLNVTKHDQPQGQLILLQFITPVRLYSFHLNEEAALWLADEVRPSKIKVASALELPKSRPLR